ncbi:MAG: UPF0016 family membrane protein [Oligoflexia bacterium]|nr:MAG: UPF0016 family membrane protein [Oligoflexia bacterium]
MEDLVQSFLLVVLGEMGDKTQLLALILTARYKKPWTIMWGIFAATILNHGLAAAFGGHLSSLVEPNVLRWILGLTFIGFAVWVLIPDKDDGLDQIQDKGVFWTTLTTFFLAEMGDKTQLATIALGAKYQNVILVTIGTTLGMLVADGLAVFLGERLTQKMQMKWIRLVAAFLFFIFGVGILIGLHTAL